MSGEPTMTQPSEPTRHRMWEDAVAVVTATGMLSLGIVLLSSAQLVTGGTSGLALLISYSSGADFGLTFFLINLPFYLLSFARMGWRATTRTFVAVALMAGLTRLTPGWITLSGIAPAYAALIGGVLLGVGMLILFRHRTTLGGINLLALYAQEKHGLSAGYVQMTLDGLILCSAFLVLEPWRVLLSLVATFVLNVVLATNHRPGRYTASS